RISIAVNKQNLTHDMVLKTGKFSISVLTEETPFSVFSKFGYHSGKDTDKFADVNNIERCTNGTAYLPEYSNAIICAKVVDTQDYGTHTLFVGEVESSEVLSDSPSLTYSHYLENTRVKTVTEKKKGFRCKICDYIYEGETLPTDYICPVCKHGAADFEPIE
ncbi:MAG: flavin reductase, partial [bacterium]|nr:flavin reductase [bacterium]